MTFSSELFLLGVIAGLIGAALFGLSQIVYKAQSENISPLLINALKMWVALPVMVGLVLLFLPVTPYTIPVTAVPPLAVSILFGAVFGDFLYLTSQARIGVSRAFPIAMTFPLVTYLFSILFLNEPILVTRIIGVIFAIVGVSVITREQSQQVISSNTTDSPSEKRFDKIGVLLAIITAFFWAAGALTTQIAIENIEPIQGNMIRVLSGSITLIPIVFFARKRGIPYPTKHTTKLVLIAGFFGMGLGSILYVFAVKYTGAAITSVIASTAPLFAAPLSFYFLKEKMTLFVGVGTILTILGIWLVILGI
jgi:drug/metabolite transporter (DMT)-like permease